MAKVTAEDNLLMAGFQTTIDSDSNGYDSSWDDSDVLKALQANPDLTVGQISPKINIPVHRVVAAIARLKTAGKFPVNPPAGIVVDFPICSKGIIATVETPVTTEEPLTVITLWQPWATFIIKGIKCFETRSWPTNHRGKILIHAAKRPINWDELDIESLECYHPDVKSWDYPLGAIVGEASLESCTAASYRGLDVVERICGNFETGRFAWEMRSPKPLLIPDVKGKQGLWKYEPLTVNDVVLGETVQSDEPLNCEQSQTNILLEEPPRLIEPDGQLSLFFDDSEEPPDPDDYGDKYEEVYQQWAVKFPELAQAIAKGKAVLGETMTAIAHWEIGQRFKPSYAHDAVSFEVVKKKGDNIWLKFDPPTANTHKFTISEILKYFPDAHKEAVKKSNAVLGESYQFQKGDRVQKISNPKWIGEIKSFEKTGAKIKTPLNYEYIADLAEYRLFSKANSDDVLGESFFNVGDKVITMSPGFDNRVFTVKRIASTGMVIVTFPDRAPGQINNDLSYSFPSMHLSHYAEVIKPTVKNEPEITTRKRPAKGCGSGYLMTRAANIRRNEAKGKSPDIYYVYCFSYTNQYGKEIKSSLSVPRAKIAQVKSMIEKREHYVKICRFLGRSVPMSY